MVKPWVSHISRAFVKDRLWPFALSVCSSHCVCLLHRIANAHKQWNWIVLVMSYQNMRLFWILLCICRFYLDLSVTKVWVGDKPLPSDYDKDKPDVVLPKWGSFYWSELDLSSSITASIYRLSIERVIHQLASTATICTEWHSIPQWSLTDVTRFCPADLISEGQINLWVKFDSHSNLFCCHERILVTGQENTTGIRYVLNEFSWKMLGTRWGNLSTVLWIQIRAMHSVIVKKNSVPF